MSTYVGQAVDVEGQPLGHGEHLNGKSAFLCQAINREPVERLVNGTAGDETGHRSFVYHYCHPRQADFI